MVMTDPIADMLTRIRNASSANHDQVDIPASRVKQELARVLKEEGYVRDYRIVDEDGRSVIRVFLKYGPNKGKAIAGIKRISKPGLVGEWLPRLTRVVLHDQVLLNGQVDLLTRRNAEYSSRLLLPVNL
jgi:ribosomal protein S8